MNKLTTIFFIFIALTTKGQIASFVWSDERCEYESLFDSTAISREQITNAFSLVVWDEFRFNNTPLVFSLNDILWLNFDTLNNEYTDKKNRLQKIKLPNNEAWNSYKNKKLNEIEQVYKISNIMYKAFINNDYSDLKTFNTTDTCLIYYSNALIFGGDSLLSAWRYLTEVQASKNGFPEKVWAKYDEQIKSNLKYQHGKVQLLTFGWWNCAIRHVDFFDNQNAYVELSKLFISTKEIYCAEP